MKMLDDIYVSFDFLVRNGSAHVQSVVRDMGVNAYDEDIQLFELRNVVVDRFGVYLPEHKKYLLEASLASLLRQKGPELTAFLSRANVLPTEPSNRDIRAESRQLGFFCSYPWDVNYQHFFIETLPRIYLMKMFAPTHNEVPDIILTSKGFSSDFIGGLGLRLNTVSYLTDLQSASIEYERLFVTTPINVNMWKIKNRWLRASVGLLREVSSGKVLGDEKVFIDRKKLPSNNGSSRMLINKEEVDSATVHHGYSLLHMESMGLSEKLEVLNNVKSVVTPLGAGLVNLAFCRNLEKVYVFGHEYLGLPSEWFEQFLQGIVNPSVKFHSVKTSINIEYKGDKHAPYTVDLENLEELLRQ